MDGDERPDASGFTFFLGTHHASWLTRTDVPLFISRRSLDGRTTLPRARGSWALDSGGFSELSLHGRWTVEPRRYAEFVARAADEIGGLAWAAIQDWMCEEAILQRTGRSVAQHQRATIDSWLELKSIAPELPWAPVLQGWTRGDYLDHLYAYARAGVDLTSAPVVGVGSVCRRQHTLRAAILMNELNDIGLNVHAFGFKTSGLTSAWQSLASSDSLAWSLNARKNPPHPDCDHARCANCLRYALAWRDDLLARLK
ncbi:MAG: hypothetical protein HYS27_23130 [Deltaproteobacteria bacterium]|nr:hypothetical protein [Deltaproteobacteria bacterium]